MNSGTAILKMFYQAAGEFVPTTQLAKSLRTPAEKIAIEVAELERLGYKIELHPHRGYRLLESPDRLMADDLEARLDAVEASGTRLQTAPTTRRIVGSEILVFEETASTNDVCEQLARSGGRDGLVVFAESQTKGRGRRGRIWASPRGKGLWFSVLLRPKLPLSSAPRITVSASVAVAHAIRETSGLDARIKWPNDVIVNGRKTAGILVETSACFAESSKKIGGTGVPACVPTHQGITAFTVSRRNLPHWQNPGEVYFVTFRVRRGDVLSPQMRGIVLEACRHWHGRKYHLYAVSVMSDHVHLLLWPRPIESGVSFTETEKGVHSLGEILYGIKSFTAHQIQRQCGWNGSVWMDESFDRIVRDDTEFMEKWNYIAQNAVKKGLATTAEDYQWFWYAPEILGAEPEQEPQAGTPVPPRQDSAGQCVILGIGIDVNCQQDEFPPEVAAIATSLRLATGNAQNRLALAAVTLRALDQWYRAALTKFDTVTDEWARLSTTLGKQIVVTVGKRRIEGCAQALDGDGALLVRKDNGQVERMLGGDLVQEL